MKFSTLFLATITLVIPAIAVAEMSAQDAYKSAHQNMMDQMMHPLSGDADKDFVMMMIPHHQGAIEMAEVELKYGKDEKLRAMAQIIIEAQTKEIQELKDWQAAHH